MCKNKPLYSRGGRSGSPMGGTDAAWYGRYRPSFHGIFSFFTFLLLNIVSPASLKRQTNKRVSQSRKNKLKKEEKEKGRKKEKKHVDEAW